MHLFLGLFCPPELRCFACLQCGASTVLLLALHYTADLWPCSHRASRGGLGLVSPVWVLEGAPLLDLATCDYGYKTYE
jgi:hypothetical protein